MEITRECRNRRAYYTLNGKPIGVHKLIMQCGQFLSGYGLDVMFERLEETGKCVIELDKSAFYSQLLDSAAAEKLNDANEKIAQLEARLAAIKKAITA